MARSKDSYKKGKMADSTRRSPKSPRSPKSENKRFEIAGNKENSTPTKVLEPIKEEKSDSDLKRPALTALNAEIPLVSLEEEKKKTSVKEEFVAEPKEETRLQVEETSSKSSVDEQTTQQEQQPQVRSDVDVDSATTEEQQPQVRSDVDVDSATTEEQQPQVRSDVDVDSATTEEQQPQVRSDVDVDSATTEEEQPQIGSDDESSSTTEEQPSEIVTEESTNSRRDQTTDAFGELVEVSGSSFGSFFVKFSKDPLSLPRSIMLPSVMETNGENKLQQRYYKYRAKKVAEYCVHPVMDKNRQEKRICTLCAEGFPGQDFNISKKLLEEDVPDYVLEMLVTAEDMEKEIKNKTNQLYQQHVLVNGFMAKLFGQSLGKSKKFSTNTGKEELGKLHKLAKAYTLVVDVIHSLVTDNSLESWWQAFGDQQEDDESLHGDTDFEEKLAGHEVDVKNPLSESKDYADQSNVNDEEILLNRKELDSMPVKLGEKVFEKKGILSKSAEPSNFSVKFSDRSEKCIGTSM